MHGLPTIGTIGLGWLEVSGRSRVPRRPPSRQPSSELPPRLARVEQERGDGDREAGPEDPERPVRAPVGHHREAEARVEEPGRELAEEVDLEAVAAASANGVVAIRKTSRAGIASATHGSRPACQRSTTATSISSRSASGSAILPNADSTCQRRARKPSIWSVTAAAPKRIAAARLLPPSAVRISAA